jgi:hypothetical protein
VAVGDGSGSVSATTMEGHGGMAGARFSKVSSLQDRGYAPIEFQRNRKISC